MTFPTAAATITVRKFFGIWPAITVLLVLKEKYFSASWLGCRVYFQIRPGQPARCYRQCVMSSSPCSRARSTSEELPAIRKQEAPPERGWRGNGGTMGSPVRFTKQDM